MSFLNVEIKARTKNSDAIREYLLNNGAVSKGTDHQTDTYFNVPNGRLKLREGNIENNLIFYNRSNQAGPKSSHFNLSPVADPASLKAVLSASLGVKVAVVKKREIYFIENVKFHIDTVNELGNFVEIEASNLYAPKTQEELLTQCEFYMKAFDIVETDLIAISYSDMLLNG
ncbi:MULTISPECIES: class IV adenylate cyclase [unclassified Paraflavitalea]|jgi:adenylate cyclase, class 2|uniref:class IV adenylate cyclase n=1 Tax=unclassified Paraflavitalea TaxID=2798305 RepID=UPI003D330751